MNIQTHRKIDQGLCGQPVAVEKDTSRVEMETLENMVVDDSGLVHGGFVFGLADHAAMIAVNHPNVVLGSAEVKFLKPVKAGQQLVAEARVTSMAGKKSVVAVNVTRGRDSVFEGTFVCFALDRHVLS